MVDEFRTTKISSIDDKVLEQVQRLKHKGKGSNTVLRGLLWSSTSNKFVNRDRNAALNILRCATLAVRPSILTRHDAQGALKQRIGKWIH
jgi:transposase